MPKPIRYKDGWRVNFRWAGKQYRKRFATRTEAIQYIETIRLDDLSVPAKRTIAAYVSEYNKWCELVQKRSHETIRKNRTMLKAWLEYLDSIAVVSPLDISKQHGYGFQTYYHTSIRPRTMNYRSATEPTGHNTFEKYRQTVSAWSNWMFRMHPDQITVNPMTADGLKIKGESRPPNYLNRDETEGILRYFETRKVPGIFPTFFRLLIYTGMRLSEAHNLKWAQVDLVERTITVIETKTKRSRILPISKWLLPHLEELYNPNHVYVFGTNEPTYHLNTYLRELKKALAVMGIRDCRVHDFRHTAALRAIEAGADILTVKAILGHTKLDTTQRYLQAYSVSKARTALDSDSFR